MTTISKYAEYDETGRVIARHTITRQTYAVPTRHAGTALNMVTTRVARHLPMGTTFSDRVVGAGNTDPDTGRPEVLVEVVGDERAHCAMLGHFAWMGY